MFVLSFSTGNWVLNRSMKCTQNGSIVVRTTLSDNSISATAEIWIGLRGLCGRVFALQNIYRDPKTKGLSLLLQNETLETFGFKCFFRATYWIQIFGSSCHGQESINLIKKK